MKSIFARRFNPGRVVARPASAAVLLGLAVAMLSFNPRRASASELLTNGNFETGSFAGWLVTNQSGGTGSFSISTPGAITPISSHTTAPNPGGGSFYAVSDQTGPGAHALTQSFVVPAASLVTVSFDMFINNYDGNPTTNGLDYTVTPTENGRVDILTGSAGALSTSPLDIVTNLIPQSGPTTGLPLPYTHYSFDITSSVGGGGVYQIRFAEADNQSYFNVGVDNVSVTRADAVPEATTLAIVPGLLLLMRRRWGRARR